MNNIKYILGSSLLNIDDFFARHHIYFDLFTRKEDKLNHISFLSEWGFALIFDSNKKEIKS